MFSIPILKIKLTIVWVLLTKQTKLTNRWYLYKYGVQRNGSSIIFSCPWLFDHYNLSSCWRFLQDYHQLQLVPRRLREKRKWITLSQGCSKHCWAVNRLEGSLTKRCRIKSFAVSEMLAHSGFGKSYSTLIIFSNNPVCVELKKGEKPQSLLQWGFQIEKAYKT